MSAGHIHRGTDTIADLTLANISAPTVAAGVGTLNTGSTDTNLATFTTAVNARLDDVEVKINDILAKLRTAGVIDT